MTTNNVYSISNKDSNKTYRVMASFGAFVAPEIKDYLADVVTYKDYAGALKLTTLERQNTPVGNLASDGLYAFYQDCCRRSRPYTDDELSRIVDDAKRMVDNGVADGLWDIVDPNDNYYDLLGTPPSEADDHDLEIGHVRDRLLCAWLDTCCLPELAQRLSEDEYETVKDAVDNIFYAKY